jgi:hypothetical protein
VNWLVYVISARAHQGCNKLVPFTFKLTTWYTWLPPCRRKFLDDPYALPPFALQEVLADGPKGQIRIGLLQSPQEPAVSKEFVVQMNVLRDEVHGRCFLLTRLAR